MATSAVSGGPSPRLVRFADDPQLDAFGRVRVSNPATLFDSKHLNDKLPLFWDEAIVNTSGLATSVHSTITSSVTMHVEAGDSVIRQTFRRFNAQPGKSQNVNLAMLLGPGVAGVTKRVGFFDANNGLFLEQVGTALRMVTRNGGVDVAVEQAAWSVDPLNGLGPSQTVLDVAQVQVFGIDFQSPAVGRVRFSFSIGGIAQTVHQRLSANLETAVFMASPNLPIRYEIVSTTGISDLVQISSTVISEGGEEPSGIRRTVSTNGVHVDANAALTIYAVVGIRLKATHLSGTVLPLGISMITQTADNFEWLLLLDPVVAGTFTYNDEPNSAVQAARGATANTVTGGIQHLGGYASNQQRAAFINLEGRTKISLGSFIDGTPQTIVLCVRPITINADIQGALTFEDLQ